jgi:hypothetical protein
MYLKKLKEMFNEMVLKKDASVIPDYYHPDFLLFTNQEKMDFIAFQEAHHKYYATPIQYQIEYDEETFLEHEKKVAGRIWVTTQLPNEAARKIEVIFIAEYKKGKIYRLWELTYPDWSKLPAFKQK